MRRQARVKAQPKLTQQQIIDLVIDKTARHMGSDDHLDRYWTIFDIPGKNAPTLEKMVKRGLLVVTPCKDYALSSKTLSDYESMIRFKAAAYACQDGMYKLDHARRDKQHSELWNRGKWIGKMIKRDYWCHHPQDFHFFQYDFEIDGAIYRRVRPIAGFNGIEDRVYNESALQWVDLTLTRCEIGRIPQLEFYAY